MTKRRLSREVMYLKDLNYLVLSFSVDLLFHVLNNVMRYRDACISSTKPVRTLEHAHARARTHTTKFPTRVFFIPFPQTLCLDSISFNFLPEIRL